MKKILSLVLCAALALTLAACTPAGKHTVSKVTVTYVQSPLNVPSIIEKAQGSLAEKYKAMGLDFAYSDLTSGADQTAALASGDIQILNAVGGTSVILAKANGADIKIISMYSRSPEAFMLFSNDESISSPEDLRGKTIAGPKGTNLHELLAAYLNTAGMSMEEVNFVSMDIPSALAALEGGSVDAALQAGPSAYNCMKAGKHLVTNGDGLIAATILTATTQKFYDENPDIVDAFVENQKAILDYIDGNTDEALRTVAEAIDMDVEAVREMYAMYDFSMETTQEDLDALQDTAQFLLDSGMIENAVDVNSLKLETK
jgi:sulfonate transport system substrate-binding protein